nr:hypothetical protein [Tanacetum cinerariifolium]
MHIPQAYAEAFYSNPRPQNQQTPKQNPFIFHERTGSNPQPQTLGTIFKARVWEYMVAHTERMERFKNAIFKHREEINDRIAEMFGLLKELTTSKAPKKVLIRGLNPPDDDINKTYTEVQVKEAEKETESENGTKNKPIKELKEKKQQRHPAHSPNSRGRVSRCCWLCIPHGLRDPRHKGRQKEALHLRNTIPDNG